MVKKRDSSKNETTSNQDDGGWKKTWQKKLPPLKFILGFVICMALFYLFYNSFLYINYLSHPIENFQARIAGRILRLIGYSNHISGDSILGSDFSVNIAKGCDGIEPLAMLLFGIGLFPIRFKWKWPGMLAGAISLTILNLIRIVGLFLAGIHWPSSFEFLHLHGGFIIFTILTVILWMIWANWALAKYRSEIK